MEASTQEDRSGGVGTAGAATARLRGGQLLSAISTRIVQMTREYYGRGPIKAKAYALDDIVVFVLRGSGFTPFERTMIDSTELDRVLAIRIREDFQRLMAERYEEMIEEPCGRRVLAFLSQAHIDPDVTLGVFYSSISHSTGAVPPR